MATHPAARDYVEPLLQTAAEVASERHPSRSPLALSLESDLERDAGLDSLGRVELMLRLQQRFGVELDEELALEARTPADLLAAVTEAVSARGPARTPAAVGAPGAGPPADAGTLVEVLDHYAATEPDRLHLVLDELEGDAPSLSYADLRTGAAEVAAGLRAHGLGAGDTVAIMLPSGADFFFAFHGILRAGGVPIPLYPPVRLEQLEDHCRRLAAILRNAQTRLFVCDDRTRRAGRILQGLVVGLETVATVAELRHEQQPAEAVPRQPDDLAFLQYTSGTTGTPKGVMLSHANLLANIRTMGAEVRATSDDVFVSWLPLYHDMGLIGAALATLYFDVPVVLLSPLQFMLRPHRWLWAIHRHGGTLSAGPNFAYEMSAMRIADAQLEGLDLSGWRIAFNGAEMVSARAAERFCDRFARHGFDAGAMTPVYGLAESSVGLVFPALGRGLRVDRVDRAVFQDSGYAQPAGDDDPDPLRLVGCGHVLPGHELRIVDPAGRPLADRHEGRLQFRGPSCTAGYYRNAEATRSLFDRGWLDSGDLAYVDAGEVYPTGRIKDMIIRAGRNIYPQEIEEAVAEVPGIRRHNVAVFASRAREEGPEEVIVAAETHQSDERRLDELRAAVVDAVRRVLAARPHEVVLVPPRTIPKTSSGKIQRRTARALYESGQLTRRQGLIGQFLRLALASLGPGLRRAGVAAGRSAFALRIWTTALALGGPVALLLLVLPGRRVRAALLHNAARVGLALAGIAPRIEGAAGMGRSPRVFVANHASRLDAVALRALLPGPVLFIAARDPRAGWLRRLLLARAGAVPVARDDDDRGLADLEPIRDRARAGATVAAFAEGGVGDGPGLRGFRLGPFMVAAQAGIPVVPVAIRGSRAILRPGSLRPRPGRLEVQLGAPVVPAGSDWNAALELRDRSRTFVRAHCGEPDLVTGEPGVIGNL